MGVSGSKTGREVVPHLGAAQLSTVHVAFLCLYRSTSARSWPRI